jgi:integrase
VDYRQINGLMDRMEMRAKQIFNKYINDQADAGVDPVWADFKELLRADLDRLLLRDRSGGGRVELFDLIDQVIEERTASPEYAASTVRFYRQVRDHLAAFNEHWRRPVVFANIDLDFSLDFRQFMYERGYEQNTVHGMLKYLRAFMQIGLERELHQNLAFKYKRFQVKQRQAISIYLTMDELTQMYGRAYPEHLRTTVDRFVATALTGLRFSDASKLRVHHIQDGHIRLKQGKTGALVVIPLHPIVKDVLQKYDGRLPKMANQVFNRQIKEAAKLCEWGNQVVYKETAPGGVEVVKKVAKWEMVTSHTARRSFATNLYLAGVPAQSIMRITGHKTETAFLRYIRLENKEHARIVSMSDVFKNAFYS